MQLMLQFPTGVINIERIRTSVKAFIMHEGKFLIVKEKIITPTGEMIIHDVPGGGIDHGETTEEALVREVYEEVGLKVKVGPTVAAWDFIVYNTDDPQLGVHIVCIGYRCELEGEAKIDTTSNPAIYEDIFDYSWMTPTEVIDAGDKVFHRDNMRAAVERLREWEAAGQ
jgi:ADP-ribose pyrophosphatase YjhB (NUDIX family)